MTGRRSVMLLSRRLLLKMSEVWREGGLCDDVMSQSDSGKLSHTPKKYFSGVNRKQDLLFFKAHCHKFIHKQEVDSVWSIGCILSDLLVFIGSVCPSAFSNSHSR